MKLKLKYLDKTEACYETEYALIKDIHYRKGEILKLEYINAKHCREIERLNKKMENLESELNIRDMPRMKESLKAGARLAIKQEEEIDTLEAELLVCKKEIGVLNDRIIDKALESQKLRVELFTFKEDLFEYLKALLIELSSEDGIASINPDDIDVKYIEAASRYCFPILLDERARLGDGDLHKIELADSILHKFGIETMAKYEELIERGDIDIATIDNRIPFKDVGYGTVRKYR